MTRESHETATKIVAKIEQHESAERLLKNGGALEMFKIDISNGRDFVNLRSVLTEGQRKTLMDRALEMVEFNHHALRDALANL